MLDLLKFCDNSLNTALPPDPIATKVIVYVVAALFVTVPFGLGMEPAHTSTMCDQHVASLNRLVLSDVARFARIHPIVATLRTENNGQGVGFKVFGKVLDKKSLRALAIGVYSFLATVVPVLHAALDTEHFLDAPISSNVTACSGLSAVQAAQLEAFRMMENSSCVWNLTIGPAGVIVN